MKNMVFPKLETPASQLWDLAQERTEALLGFFSCTVQLLNQIRQNNHSEQPTHRASKRTTVKEILKQKISSNFSR